MQMFTHMRSLSKSKGSKGSSGEVSSGSLFQGTTQSRQRQEQLLGCLQAETQAQEVPMAQQEEEGDPEEVQQEQEEEGDSAVGRFRYYFCFVLHLFV